MGGGPDILVAMRWAKGGVLPTSGLMEPLAVVRSSRPQPWTTGYELHVGQRQAFLYVGTQTLRTKFNVGMECQCHELWWMLTLDVNVINVFDMHAATLLKQYWEKIQKGATPTTVLHNEIFPFSDQ